MITNKLDMQDALIHPIPHCRIAKLLSHTPCNPGKLHKSSVCHKCLFNIISVSLTMKYRREWARYEV